jgi:hypothetical protein
VKLRTTNRNELVEIVLIGSYKTWFPRRGNLSANCAAFAKVILATVFFSCNTLGIEWSRNIQSQKNNHSAHREMFLCSLEQSRLDQADGFSASHSVVGYFIALDTSASLAVS